MTIDSVKINSRVNCQSSMAKLNRQPAVVLASASGFTEAEFDKIRLAEHHLRLARWLQSIMARGQQIKIKVRLTNRLGARGHGHRLRSASGRVPLGFQYRRRCTQDLSIPCLQVRAGMRNSLEPTISI
ncbi:hypothetical protein U5801_08845 [Lamprobacter modestohalophilus]|uniref:hypothetical protein n=1 Tax=Lamprobacter modestohalophilus TaxID=1064514 RepID=UPI002ADEEBD0|nr:hypothetical protein [Lamprobacter modestohalophilus]MEA1049914.1 hypothetical protein [Lamprobacter modestohalophilus]